MCTRNASPSVNLGSEIPIEAQNVTHFLSCESYPARVPSAHEEDTNLFTAAGVSSVTNRLHSPTLLEVIMFCALGVELPSLLAATTGRP